MNIEDHREFVKWIEIPFKDASKSTIIFSVQNQLDYSRTRKIILIALLILGSYIALAFGFNSKNINILCGSISALSFVYLYHENVGLPYFQTSFDRLAENAEVKKSFINMGSPLFYLRKFNGWKLRNGVILETLYKTYQELNNSSLFVQDCLKDHAWDILDHVTNDVQKGCKAEFIIDAVKTDKNVYSKLCPFWKENEEIIKCYKTHLL